MAEGAVASDGVGDGAMGLWEGVSGSGVGDETEESGSAFVSAARLTRVDVAAMAQIVTTSPMIK
ncbi:MAG: hypothetical protein LH624_03950 [Cryobacterium sp.]|nr:hypothetical protein [Cryobacterium sp.]